MPSKKANKIKKLSEERAELVSQLMDRFEELIQQKSAYLTEEVINTFLDKLSTKDGAILTEAENLRKAMLIDQAWRKFNNTHGAEIITEFITGLQEINEANLKYYRTLSDANIRPGDIKNIINYRLGIDEKGNLIKDGYMKGLLDDVSVRNEIKKSAFQQITKGTGYENTRSSLRDLIQGNSDSLGKFNQFYRNFAFDTHVQVDRLNGSLYAEKLNLRYGIYQGTRRKDSRHFCLERKGKVFSVEQSKDWVKLIGKTKTVQGKNGPKKVPIGPIVRDKATYNPLVDMGGYGCVDIFSYVSDEIAYELQPSLKGATNNK